MITTPWGDELTEQEASAVLADQHRRLLESETEINRAIVRVKSAQAAVDEARQRENRALDEARTYGRRLAECQQAGQQYADSSTRASNAFMKRYEDLKVRHEILRAERADSARLVRENPDLPELMAAAAHRARIEGVQRLPWWQGGHALSAAEPIMAWQGRQAGTETGPLPLPWEEQTPQFRAHQRRLMAQALLLAGEQHQIIRLPIFEPGDGISPSAKAQMLRESLELVGMLLALCDDGLGQLAGETVNMGTPEKAASLRQNIAHYLPGRVGMLGQIKPARPANRENVSVEIVGNIELQLVPDVPVFTWEPPAPQFKAEGTSVKDATEEPKPMEGQTADDSLIQGGWHREEWENEGGAPVPEPEPEPTSAAQAEAEEALVELAAELLRNPDEITRHNTGTLVCVDTGLLGSYVLAELASNIHEGQYAAAAGQVAILQLLKAAEGSATAGREISVEAMAQHMLDNASAVVEETGKHYKAHEGCGVLHIELVPGFSATVTGGELPNG